MEILKFFVRIILTCIGFLAFWVFIWVLPIIGFFVSIELEYVFGYHEEDVKKYYSVIEAKVKEAQQQNATAPCLELPYEIKYFLGPRTWDDSYDYLFSPQIECLQIYAKETQIPAQVKEAIEKNDSNLCLKLPAEIIHHPRQHVTNHDSFTMYPQHAMYPQKICLEKYLKKNAGSK